MQKPQPGRPENPGVELHQGVGLASAAIRVICWLLVLVRRREHGIANGHVVLKRMVSMKKTVGID
jgi:hypothetical protein